MPSLSFTYHPILKYFLPSLSFPSSHTSLEQARTTALDRLHLGVAVHRPSEPLRQLVAVPELALFRVNASHLAARTAAHEAVGLRRRAAGGAAAAAHHRAMLAGFLAVLGERLGEGLGGRGGVDLGSVVDFCGWKIRSGCGFLWIEGILQEVLRLGIERRPMNLIKGVCLKSTLVARILASGV